MTLNKVRLLAAIPRLAEASILVIGDVILDEYLTGRASRLSREAPIPVLEFESRRVIPGGAANPAMNIVALGGQALQVGLLGDDVAGEELGQQLQRAGIDTSGLVVDPHRVTTQKTRIVSHGSLRFPQQVARLDRLDRQPPPPDVESELLARVQASLPGPQAIILSDYGNGLLTPAVAATILSAARQHGVLTVVDSQGRLDKYAGFDLVRANDRDTATYLGRPLQNEADFQAAMLRLREQLAAHAVVVGRGSAGVSVLGADAPYTHLPAVNPSEVFDVTGAGDTFTAVLAMGLVSDLSLLEATWLANYAAGWVVQKLGNATPSPQELRTALERW